MTNSIETKVVILLSPQRILADNAVLGSLHIQKKGRSFEYVLNPLDSSELRRFYPKAPNILKKLLSFFGEAVMDELAADIRKRHTAMRAGIAFDVYFRNTLLRKIHETFDDLKHYANRLKWYHKVKTDDKFKTGPCELQPTRPRLAFEIVSAGAGLQLVTKVFINLIPTSLSSFNRFHFLLEKDSNYYVLGFKDFQTLEWLAENDPSQYSHTPQLLAENILSRLEVDYPVNRNGFFSQHYIDVVPLNRVLLSEISNSFLVFTPQWLYESFLIEGEWKERYEIVKNGEGYLVNRNAQAEKAFRELLAGLHPNFAKQLNGYYYLSFAEAQKKQWFLKTYHHLLEQDIQLIGMDLLQHFRYSPHKVASSLQISENGDEMLTLKLVVSFGKEEVPLSELQKMLLAGQRAILLKDGSLGVPGNEWLQQYGTIIKHGKITGKLITVAKWLALNEQESNSGNGVLKSTLKNAWWSKWEQWQEPGTSVYEIPSQVKATLRPYQKKGYEWMRLLAEVGAGACLADDMGLGKTLQTICFIVHQVGLFPAKKNIIICPSSLVYNWLQELQKFAPHLKAAVYHGPQRNFEAMAAASDQLIITTYGTLRSDIDKLSAILFGVAVIDESHNIKNPSALITRAVKQVQAMSRVALSGTPVMNNTFDLYAQLSFLLPGMFGSREFFKSEYADAIDRDRDPEKIKALQKLTAPFILRRTKEQVASDLPDKIETVLWCRMGPDQMAAYDSIKEKVRSSIFLDIKENGLAGGKLSVINGMLKLRQVCNSCELVKEEPFFTSDSIKTDILIAELQNIITDHKALVFSQFTSMLDLLQTSLKQKNILNCRLDGSTPMAARQELVNNFQKDDCKERVFLISLKAGNAGLNLTAADYVFLFDPWWNTAVQQQAIDRTHRIGQTKNVFAYKMICKDTIEEKIIKLQERKKQLAEELVGGEESFVKSLGMDDIEFLFS